MPYPRIASCLAGKRSGINRKFRVVTKLPALITDFADLETYCMFLGHARSGHSLFGSLLDAHPEIVLAHEFNTLKKINWGLSREKLFNGLWRRSVRFTQSGRKWNGYDYKVPGQWQGRCRKLRVIGDKKGGVSSALLQRNPELLQQLRDIVGVPVKFIRVIRNPFDNIRTLCRYYHRNQLNPAIEHYFSLCETIEVIKMKIPTENWLDIYHEHFITNPEPILKFACQFLGVGATDGYLKACAGIVFDSPIKRRYEIIWTQAQRRKVEAGIGKYNHLTSYTFNS